jgi:hypothetical protein
MVAVVAYGVLRRWFLHWGATGAEITGAMPGDGLLDRPITQATRAITIDAPPAAVWPWLVQMGQDRGGLYSYDWLENLIGLHFRNADRIVPEWQDLAVGDQIRAAPPSAGPEAGFTVVAIEPGRCIVTAVGDPDVVLAQAQAGRLPQGGTWIFLVEPLDGGWRTRLVIRFRARFGLGKVADPLAALVLEPVHFVMERKQLLGIRERAERTSPGADRGAERSGLVEGLGEVGDEVGGGLDADGEPDQRGVDGEGGVGGRRVGHGRRVLDQ